MDSPYQTISAKVSTIVLMSLLAISIAVILFFLKRARSYLDHPNIYKQISYLYEGIHLYKDKDNVNYYPVFMFRRIVFVLVPTVLYAFSYFQV